LVSATLASSLELNTDGLVVGAIWLVIASRLVVPTCAPSLADFSAAIDVAPATGEVFSAITACLTS
jgi:hypothetical protein